MHLDASSLLGLAQLLGLGLALYLGVLIWLTTRRLTRPPRRTYASALARALPGDPGEALGGRPYESWTLKSRGLELPVWEIEGDAPGGAVAIFLHGWGDGRIGALTRMAPFLPRCARLLAIDLPGHGDAPGACSLGAHEARDVRALLDHALRGDDRAVLVGWSMGAGIAVEAAAGADERIAGVIAEAPYRRAITPARNVLRNAGLPHRLNLAPAIALLGVRFGRGPAWRGFDRGELASDLPGPLLVIHGVDDEVCPIRDAREVAANARVATLCEVERGRHNDLWTDQRHRERVTEAIGAFLDALNRAPGAS